MITFAVLFSASPAAAEGSESGEFPDRTFFVTRSPPRGPQSDTFTVDIVPIATGEWWVTADVIAGSAVVLSVWRDDGGSPVLESLSRLRLAGEESVRTLLTAGLAYKASFTPFGKPGTSALREHFALQILWIHQFGTAGFDRIAAVGTAGSDVYVAGSTDGTLPGQSNAGGADAFLRRYDVDGNEIWTRQFGTSSIDFATDVEVNGTGVYVVGVAGGMLPGQSSGGMFVRKYDVDGNEIWTRQFETSGTDNAFAVGADGGGVYIAGSTDGTLPGQSNAGGADAFVRKYDPSGNELWTRQFGTAGGEGIFDIATAAGSDVYVAGSTDGTLPGQSNAGGADAFLRRYDVDGNEIWTLQFGTLAPDRAHSVDVDEMGVYVAGSTGSDEPVGVQTDAFLRKYDSGGNEMWARQFGTGLFERDEAFAVDVAGSDVYVAGYTSGSFQGQSSAGSWDAFVRKYDVDGNEIWTRQFGTSDYDQANDVDAAGVFVAGVTFGRFPGQSNAGTGDAFLARIER